MSAYDVSAGSTPGRWSASRSKIRSADRQPLFAIVPAAGSSYRAAEK